MIEYHIPTRSSRTTSFIERLLESNENRERINYYYNQIFENHRNLLDDNTEEQSPEKKDTTKAKIFKRDDKYIR
ncbi:hypothetical protein H8356DRAFT_1057791 [Neocallimastix lanati (nom. inval.)]|nr:hypothetical protein H8356DRAFT_1057791 [Neocallimastix sp. JGI-2020a]